MNWDAEAEEPPVAERLDHLLDGELTPVDEDDRRIAEVVAALRAPGTPEELRGEAAARAAFRAHAPRSTVPRSAARSSSRTAAAVAVAALATVTTLTAAAATTGTFAGPWHDIAQVLIGADDPTTAPTQRAAPATGGSTGERTRAPGADPSNTRAVGSTRTQQPGGATTRPRPSTTSTPTRSTGRGTPSGGGTQAPQGTGGPSTPAGRSPSAAGSTPAARPPGAGKAVGLCRAWLAQGGDPKGVGLARQLAALAGGADKVDAYCRSVLHLPDPAGSPDPEKSSAPATSSENGKSSEHGKSKVNGKSAGTQPPGQAKETPAAPTTNTSDGTP